MTPSILDFLLSPYGIGLLMLIPATPIVIWACHRANVADQRDADARRRDPISRLSR